MSYRARHGPDHTRLPHAARFYHRYWAVKRYYKLKKMREAGDILDRDRHPLGNQRLPVDVIEDNYEEKYGRLKYNPDGSHVPEEGDIIPGYEQEAHEYDEAMAYIRTYYDFTVYLAKAPWAAIRWAYNYGKTYWLYSALGLLYLYGRGVDLAQ